uniref:Uncharacterized protein n=1 Tax=Solanum tuberosum TaxID=4113 RepID=M1D7S6_SOLTU
MNGEESIYRQGLGFQFLRGETDKNSGFKAHLEFKFEFFSHYRETSFSEDFAPFRKRKGRMDDLD